MKKFWIWTRARIVKEAIKEKDQEIARRKKKICDSHKAVLKENKKVKKTIEENHFTIRIHTSINGRGKA